MNKKLICLLVIFCMLLSVQNVVGPATTSAGSSGGSGGGGGGGSKQVDIDRLIKRWKTERRASRRSSKS